MKAKLLLCAAALAAALVPSPNAGELTMRSSSIGGGSSSGGILALRGTTGEPSPSGDTLRGGPFTVSSGFASQIAVLLTPGAPRLTPARTPGGIEISWPLPAEGFVLQKGRLIGIFRNGMDELVGCHVRSR